LSTSGNYLTFMGYVARVVYSTRGSGGNGVNAGYFVDTAGGACPNGTGLPVAGAQLPTGQ
jgi:hypothetical protein